MAVSRNQISIGAVVNPLDGMQKSLDKVGSLYLNYIDSEDKKEQRALENKRWELQNSRAEQSHTAAMDEVGRQADTRAFITNYKANPYEGGRGLDSTAVREFSDIGGKHISSLDKVKVGVDGSLVPATQEDISNPNVSTFPNVSQSMGQDVLNRLKTLSPTQESMSSMVYSDVLKGTNGDFDTAKRLAASMSKGDISRKDIVEQEEKDTKEANTLRKELAERAKYFGKIRGKGASSGSKGTLKKTYIDRDARNTAINALDLSPALTSKWPGSDTNKAIDLVDMAVDKGHDPTIAMTALKNSIDRGLFGDNLGDTSKKDFLKEVEALNKLVGSSGKTGGTSHTADELALILSTPQSAKSYSDIQKTEALNAWKGFSDKTTPSASVSTNTLLGNTKSKPSAGSPTIPAESSPIEKDALLSLPGATEKEEAYLMRLLDAEEKERASFTEKGSKDQLPGNGKSLAANMLATATTPTVEYDDNKSRASNVLNSFFNKPNDDNNRSKALEYVSRLGSGFVEDIPGNGVISSVYSYLSDNTKEISDRKSYDGMHNWFNKDGVELLTKFPDLLTKAKEDPVGFYKEFSSEGTVNGYLESTKNLDDIKAREKTLADMITREDTERNKLNIPIGKYNGLPDKPLQNLVDEVMPFVMGGTGVKSLYNLNRNALTPKNTISNSSLRTGNKQVVSEEAKIANRLNQNAGKRAFGGEIRTTDLSVPKLTPSQLNNLEVFRLKHNLNY